jgi:ABC-type multidrug transport system permease subunit
MLEMFGEAALGLVAVAVGLLLIFIGMPRHGEHPRFLRFEASVVVYPAVIITLLAMGSGLMLRAYTG